MSQIDKYLGKVKLTIIVLFSFLELGLCQITNDSGKIWERGKKAVSEGRIEEALHIWESAITTDNANLNTDPRIGIDFIELVTAHEMKDYYKAASEIFYWGLSGNCNLKHRDELSLELERIKPILTSSKYQNLEEYLPSKLGRLCSDLVKFWKQLDPTISTLYNERLIEHWERIAYARETFTRNRSTVYRADDRATVYVKLGKADYEKKDVMQFNKSMVRAWVADAIEFQFRGGLGSSSGSFGGDSSSAAGGSISGQGASVSQGTLSGLWQKTDIAEKYAREAELLHRYQRYEIWIYHNLLENNDNLIYIFGQNGDTGEFGKINSLEDMIPSSAFRNRSTTGSLLRPGLLLQLLFYQQVSHIDNYFSDAFSDLESRLVTTSGLNRATSFATQLRNEHKLSYIEVRAPKQKSTYLKEMPEVDIEVYQYRLLDNNLPYLATFVNGKPQKAFFFDQITTNSFNPEHYKLHFFSNTTDEENNSISHQSKSSPIYYNGRGNVEEMKASTAYFHIPQTKYNLNQTFTAELLNRTWDSTKIGDLAFPETVRAIGLLQRKQPKPLTTDTEILEVSDIIIGTADSSRGDSEKGIANFPVVHDNIIPQKSNLMLHYEVYHLEYQDGHPSKFKVEYEVKPLKKNIFQRIFGNRDRVGITINYDAFNSFYKSDLEIETSSFDTGKYKLTLVIKEPDTEREVSREKIFEIR